MLVLRFLGAAQTITGSRFLLRTKETRILIDCGLFQGGRSLKQRNWRDFPVSPSRINAVLLTHAHLDHSGYLPRLLKQGFQGPIYCTPATAELLSLLLPDSGRLQEEDAAYANRKKYSRHDPALPLYTEKEAREVLKLLHPVSYHKVQGLSGQLDFEYLRAGHILGSAMIRARYSENGATTSLLFSGDLGRPGQPIIKDPENVSRADLLILESTYGDQVHEKVDVLGYLERLVKRTVEAGGSLIIPAFAVGRCQNMLYRFRNLEETGRIPSVPVFLDSPMAVSAVPIFCNRLEEHDLEMQELMSDVCPLQSGNLHMVRTVEESKALNRSQTPCVIISASGTLAGGRILHHLQNRLSDARNTVLFVGYQPVGSLGRLLVEGRKRVKIHGVQVPVRANIACLNALSAHADSEEIVSWLAEFDRAPSHIFLVHGEVRAQEALTRKLGKAVSSQVILPKYLQRFDLEEMSPGAQSSGPL